MINGYFILAFLLASFVFAVVKILSDDNTDI